MKKRSNFSIIFCFLVLLLFVCNLYVPAFAEDVYPYTQADGGDKWGFARCECTSFVAWCLNTRNGIWFNNFKRPGTNIDMPSSISYVDPKNGNTETARWGHAFNWRNAAEQIGYVVDNNPAEGAVAYWNAYDNASMYGHVAWVSAVNGSEVIIEEYNGTGENKFGRRPIAASNPTGYIHIYDLGIVGSMDATIRTDENHIRIYGWAYDRTMQDTALEIHVYLGGPAGSDSPGRIVGHADNYRDDLQRSCGYDIIYDATGIVEDLSTVPIYVYAVNPQRGRYLYLGHKNINPEGRIDALSGRDGAIYIRGWTFDPDAAYYYPDIHIYVGSEAGQGKSPYIIHTSDYAVERTDVANYYGSVYTDRTIGNYHGFEFELPVTETGDQNVYIYAINNEQGTHNPLIPLDPGVSSRMVTIGNAVKSYTITYDDRGDEGVQNMPETQTYTGPAVISNVIPTRPGYICTGWTTSQSSLFSAVEYQAGDTYTGNEDLVLYPVWTGAPYTVYFDPNGGICDTPSKTVYNTAMWYGALPVPSRMGHHFIGWFTEPDGGRMIISDTYVSLTEDQTLYAHWKKMDEMVLPNDLITIDDEAFYQCAEEYVMIPESVTYIGKQAFAYSTNLVNVCIFRTTTFIAQDAFEGHNEYLTIFCQENSAAQALAEEKGIRYHLIDDAD